MTDTSTQFTGSVPEFYHRYLGPVLFEPYADDLAGRLSRVQGTKVLELACGTGILTKKILGKLPEQGTLVASDLNEAMIDVAKKYVSSDDRLTWKVADALSLSFPDRSLDEIVCQFGIMFFPDKLRAAREVRRVLKNGGRYLFNVWDGMENNDLVRTGQSVVEEVFPNDPPKFYTVPMSYHDDRVIASTLEQAGFHDVTITRVPRMCRSRTARDAARGFIYGNPIAIELTHRGADAEMVTQKVAERLASRYGSEPMECGMRAVVVEAR